MVPPDRQPSKVLLTADKALPYRADFILTGENRVVINYYAETPWPVN
jgi:hypothetical protein|tara:strand:+ start:1001 stop:1141 length:141 start_codon:yes stop_codon:yes gene_type:complete